MKTASPLLFLDIDGVLNSHDWYHRRGKERRFHINELDPEACARLQDVCSQTSARIVITSTWRKIHSREWLRRLLRKRGVTAPIIGTTPDLWSRELEGRVDWFSVGRGLEIQWWLQTFMSPDELDTVHTAIVDDESDMGDLEGILVQTSINTGLTDDVASRLVDQLRQPLRISSAAGGPGYLTFEHDVLAVRAHGGTGPRRRA